MLKLRVNYWLYLAVILLSGSVLLSCSDDDDDDVNIPEPDEASLTVSDQNVSDENTLTVESATFPNTGWLVVHRDNGGMPSVPDIISVPKLVEAGTTTDVEITLADGVTIEDGETLWVMMHTDDGESGSYEFDGNSGLDAPLLDENGAVITEEIVVSVMSAGSFEASDQEIMDNQVVIQSITLEQNGWVVIHADDDGEPMVPEIISEPKFLEAGTHSEVSVALAAEAEINEGDAIWIMLHTDTGAEGEYEFDGSNGLDSPILDSDEQIVTAPITITAIAATGSFQAEDQAISQNKVLISEVSLNRNGWIVVHKDNGSGGPMVPEIISEPLLVQAGTHSNLEVQLDGSESLMDGETLWIMLHTDTGTEGIYEFDGSNDLDNPILDSEEAVVTAPIVVSAPSITAADQVITENQIVIAEVVAARDGWLVIHNDDGTGSITVPDNVGMARVTAGVNTDVVVELDDTETYTAGQLLFPMLHLDLDPVEEYNFPGVDLPEVFGFETENVIVTSFTVQ